MTKLLFAITLLSVFSLTAQISYDKLQDGTKGITNGYGSWGVNSVIKEAEIVVDGKGIITFYHPEVVVAKKATIFFISGWGRQAGTYEYFFHFLASQGYAVVNIYNTKPGNIKQSYQNSLDMMVLVAQKHYSNWIDTKKVGLMGHSYGAGSIIWLGKKVFDKASYNWGKEGRFIFMTAPWYSLLVTEDDLRDYPENVKLLIEVNNDDERPDKPETWTTDERAIRAVFELINIPNSEKDFVRVYSSDKTFQYNNKTYSYKATHHISYTASSNSKGVYQTYDALDVFAINRLSHALIDYVFEGSQAGKNIALGNGNADQINMDFLTKLNVTDTPILKRPENEYVYKCTSNWNDFADNKNVWYLQKGCADGDGDGLIDLLEKLSIDNENESYFGLYPVPASKILQIRFTNGSEQINELEIRDATGKLVYQNKQVNSDAIDISNLTSGVYFLKIRTETRVGVHSFLVK